MMNVKTILIAEDDADDRLLMQVILNEKEFGNNLNLHFFDNGAELIKFLPTMSHEPVCILMDLNMPKLDGFETLCTLKQQNRYKHIPVIIMSTSDNKGEKGKCLQHGAATYLVKPDTYNQWHERLQELMLPYFTKHENALAPRIFKTGPGAHYNIRRSFSSGNG